MRMCGINQVHGGFTHEHTQSLHSTHTQHTHSASNTNTEAVPMALKGISQSFWLEHFNRVFYCAHILCRLCSKFSSLAGACVGDSIAHKVENSLEPNISESLHVCSWVCLWPVVRGPAVGRRLQRDCWRCSGKTALRHIMRAEIPDLRQYSQSEGWERNRKRNAQCLHST